MSEWGSGFLWGVLSAGPVAVMVMGLVCAAGRASEVERRREDETFPREGRVRKGGVNRGPTTPRPSTPPPGQGGHRWTDENKGAA